MGACCSAACVGGRFIFVGLFGRGLVRYDPLTNTYAAGASPLSPLPLADWHGFSAVARGPYLYLVGGIARGKWTARVFRCDTRSGAVEPLPDMRTPRRRPAAVVL